jgi:hypothetical protein
MWLGSLGIEMAAVSSSSGFQAVTQAAYQQLKVQQARQNADRAEEVARALAARAGDARQVAEQAQESARVLTVQSNQAQTAAGQARQGLAAMDSAGRMQASLANTADQVVTRSAEPVSTGVESKSVAPVVNTSGQVTGTLVNTTA